MKKIVVFLGPSLPVSEAKKILNAIYLPPAEQSDLISAVITYEPDVIALIDGVFYKSPSVWHKEILYALEQGVAVYGSSSMGALRAAETADFGMIGIGEIYRMYASGKLLDDDEVALIHSTQEEEYRPLSEPMVNVRSTFRRAQNEGIISEGWCQQLTAIAKSIYFPERTFPAIFRQAATVGLPLDKLEEMAVFVKEKYVDTKREDAILLLQTLKDLPKKSSELTDNFTLARNPFFAAIYRRERRVTRGQTSCSFGRIAAYVALHSPDFDETNFHALNFALVQVLAQLLGIEVSPEEADKESHRFRLKYTLLEEAKLTDWLTKNDLKFEEFNQLMYEMAGCRKLHKWLISRKSFEKNVTILLNELRLQNRYERWADAATKQEQIIQEHSLNDLENLHEDLPLPQLILEHLRSTDCQMPINYTDWANEAGFLNIFCLELELLKSRLARKVMQNLAFKRFSVRKPVEE